MSDSENSTFEEDFGEGNLLIDAIRNDNDELFDSLLNSDQNDINAVDYRGRSVLLCLVDGASHNLPYYVSELIQKGADVNQGDYKRCTFLHLGGAQVEICKILLENGADVNAQNIFGETPIHNACQSNNLEYIYVLLYYGANVTISCKKGYLPIYFLDDNLSDLQEIFLYYMFSDDDVILDLKSLIWALTTNSSIFEKLCRYNFKIAYNAFSLRMLRDSFNCSLPLNNFRLFLERFSGIVKKMLPYSRFIDFVCMVPVRPSSRNHSGQCDCSQFFEFMHIIFESDLVSNFVKRSGRHDSIFTQIIKAFGDQVTVDKMTELICLMLSRGIDVTSEDMETVFKFYGNYWLFQILLDMDIKIVYFHFNRRNLQESLSPKPLLMYDIKLDVTKFLFRGWINQWPYCWIELLDYFRDPFIRDLFKIMATTNGNHELLDKIKKMPNSVPSLVELSRGAARAYIIDVFQIKTCSQFYTILKRLPIGEPNKRILSFQQKVYF